MCIKRASTIGFKISCVLSKTITKQVAEQLLAKGRAKLKKCRSARTGKTYNATVVLTTKENGQAEFSLDFENGGK